MAKVIVTGVAGFIGSHIAEHLLRGNNTVIGIDDLSAGYERNIPPGVIFIKEDICKADRIASVFKDASVVFHNAASKKNICLNNPNRDMEVNGIGTLKLLQLCVDKGVNKFIHASTGSVYGEIKDIITEDTPRNPVSYYGISKMAGESYVYNFRDRLNITILRYFHVYGERQESNYGLGGVIAIFTEQIKNKGKIIIHGDGKQSRVFTNVADIANANIKAWHNNLSRGKIYNCASSVQMSIIDVALALMKKYKTKIPITYTDPLIGDIYNFNVDSSRIKEIGVEFKPITDYL